MNTETATKPADVDPTIAAETETTESSTTETGPVRGEVRGVVSRRDELREQVARMPELEQASRDALRDHKELIRANQYRFASMAEAEQESHKAQRVADAQVEIARRARYELLDTAPQAEHDLLSRLEAELRRVSTTIEAHDPLIPQLHAAIERHEGHLAQQQQGSHAYQQSERDLINVREQLATVVTQVAAAQAAVDAQTERMLSI